MFIQASRKLSAIRQPTERTRHNDKLANAVSHNLPSPRMPAFTSVRPSKESKRNPSNPSELEQKFKARVNLRRSAHPGEQNREGKVALHLFNCIESLAQSHLHRTTIAQNHYCTELHRFTIGQNHYCTEMHRIIIVQNMYCTDLHRIMIAQNMYCTKSLAHRSILLTRVGRFVSGVVSQRAILSRDLHGNHWVSILARLPSVLSRKPKSVSLVLDVGSE